MMSLVPFELKKLLKKKSVIGAVIALFLALYLLFYGNFQHSQLVDIHGDFSSEESIALNIKFAQEHTGYVSDDLVRQTIKDYTEERWHGKDHFNVFAWMVTDVFNRDYLVNFPEEGAEVDFEHLAVASQEELGAALPFKELKLGLFTTWNQLFETINMAFVLVILLATFICSPVFSGDKAKSMDTLLLTTSKGRNQLTKAKLFSTLLIGTVSFLVVNTIILGYFAYYFGFGGWDVSVQMNLHWISPFANILAFPVPMTMLGLLIRLLIFQYIGLLFILAITFFVSSYSKVTLATFALSAGFFFALSFLTQIFPGGLFNKVLTLFSVSTGNLDSLLLNLSHASTAFFDNFTVNAVFVIAVRLLLAILLVTLAYNKVKQVKK